MLNKNRGFSSVVLVVIILILLGGGYWLWKNKAVAPAPAPTDGSLSDDKTDPTSITDTISPLRISDITPSSGFPGTVVTLSGIGFVSAGVETYIGISESGQKAFIPDDVSPTKLTFNIPDDLTPGDHDIIVFTSARQTPTSNKVIFTVLGSAKNQ